MSPDWHELADPEMIEWCTRLNAIPGVETRQSCSGHKVGESSKCEMYDYETDGNIWFVCDWLVDETAFELARIPTMSRVRLLFFPDGEKVWDLTFVGNNKGLLDKSMSKIAHILHAASRGTEIATSSGFYLEGDDMISEQYYILDDKMPVLCTNIHEWARWFKNADRQVARTENADMCVSTVFLGLNHQFGDGAPLLFETLVFGGEYDGDCDRYTTWEGAERGHRIMCERVFGRQP